MDSLVALSDYTGKASEISKMKNKHLIALRHPEPEFLTRWKLFMMP